MFLRAFTPKGTLKSAKELLPYISSLGFDIVYLCPIVEADDDCDKSYWSERQKKSGFDNPRNPYRIKNYYKIDEEYGNDDDLRDFVKKAHSVGLKVILDLVYYHSGPNADYIKDHPDFVTRDEQGNVLSGKWKFPINNFNSPGLRNYLWDNMTYFIEKFEVDGYRCDVGDNVPLDFWEEGVKRIRKLNPSAIMINEGVEASYLDVFDVNYCFEWSYMLQRVICGETQTDEIRSIWEKYNTLYSGKPCLRALNTHDMVNDSYDRRSETVAGNDATEAALVLNFTIDGVPFLYNGEEIADENRHSIFANRYHGNGNTIDWSMALTEAGQKRTRIIRELCRIRHVYNALEKGRTEWVECGGEKSVLLFLRRSDEQCVGVYINMSSGMETIKSAFSIAEENIIIKKGVRNDSIENGEIVFEQYGYLVFLADTHTSD